MVHRAEPESLEEAFTSDVRSLEWRRVMETRPVHTDALGNLGLNHRAQAS